MRGTSMSAKTSTHLRPLSKAPLPKMTERERRNEELSELKKALQLSEAKHSQCSVRLAKWKKIALDAERSSLKTTDYENKLKKEYEAQLEELEGRYIERSKEAAETIERLEDTNKKLKKEITLLRMKEKPTAEPARVVQRRATVQTDQLSQTVPPPVHVSRAKSNALVFSINDTVRAIEDELRSHRRRPTDETNLTSCDKDETLAPSQSQLPITDAVPPTNTPSYVPSQRHLRNVGHEAVVPRSHSDLGNSISRSRTSTSSATYSRPPRSRTLEHLSRTLPDVFRKRGSQPITSSSLRPTLSPSESPSTRHSYNNELYTSPSTPQFGHSPSTSSSFSSYCSSETSADYGHHANINPHYDPRWCSDTLTHDPVSISPDNYDYYDDIKTQPLSHQLRDSILDSLLTQANYK